VARSQRRKRGARARAQGASAPEFKAAHAACLLQGRRAAGLAEQLARAACVLVMEFVPGAALLAAGEPFQPARLPATATDLGRCARLQLKLADAANAGGQVNAGW